MLKLTQLVTFAAEATAPDRAAVLSALRAAAGGARALIEPTLDGHYNGGDLLCHVQLDGRAALDAWQALAAPILARAAVAHVDSAAYAPGTGALRSPQLRRGVYRSLLLSVDPAAPKASVAALEAQLRAMPEHLPEIRNWRLSRVVQASGSLPWSHVWEQEFDDLAGLQGPYMTHPCHWALVDRWFDPEVPEHIVRPLLCHSFCAVEASIMGG